MFGRVNGVAVEVVQSSVIACGTRCSQKPKGRHTRARRIGARSHERISSAAAMPSPRLASCPHTTTSGGSIPQDHVHAHAMLQI